MKKFLSIALVFAMLLSFALVASAEETTTTYTITIENSTSGYTYAAYQIFSGELAVVNVGTEDEKTVLTNIQWGSGVNTAADGFQAAILAAVGVTDLGEETFDAEFVASKLTGGNAAAFAKEVGKYLTSTKTDFIYNNDAETKNYTANVSGGYYLIQNTENGIPANGAYTAYILEVAGNVTAKPKTGVPTIEKKVHDCNDTAGEAMAESNLTTTYDGIVNGGWTDSADHDIGDTVWYKVTFTIPANTLNNYGSYELKITDTLSKGLTFNNDSKFYRLVVDKDDDFKYTNDGSYFEVAVSEGSESTTLTASVDDLISKIDLSGSDVDFSEEYVFCWVYSCTLNSDAVIGSNGNPNTVYLEYSNNPNGNGTGKTPKDTAIVFTYQVDVNKVDQAKEPLTGANFTLYKQVPTGTAGANTGAAIKETLDSKVKADALHDDKSYIVVGNKTGDATGSTFNFKGIDDGTYVLVETTIPDGYNAWESKEFTVTATHPGTTLESLSGGNNLFTGEVDLDNGKLSTTIENKSGNTLPSTGGMGTTIFYVFGTVLVLGAGILLIAKRRVAR